ncbi:1-acyl-sn-glycerol-3-phosphate acyltransferase [Spirochaetia bacterium]|nr:1-acyl-sn-glycerol-3-phosphate acyltransferase [Spirochaetia bacterium]
MALLRTVAIFMVVILAMVLLIPMGVLAFIPSLVGFKKLMALCIYRIAQGWARMLIKITGCRLTVLGRENIPRTGGVCFVSNHGSIFDILLHLAYVGRPFGFVAKKELVFVPMLNIWIFLLGGLFIDRKNVRKAIKTINRGIEHIKAGGAMIIFPEGHRSRGQGLLPFHPGSLKLATQAGAPIIPAALAGSYEVFEKTGRIQAVPVKLVYEKPINTADLPHEEKKQILADRIRGVIAEALL